MSGIAGIIDPSSSASAYEKNIEKMKKSLKHRGPDEGGVYFSRCAALAHTRLCVVDAKNGKQPMTKTIGGNNFTVVYNGELYNAAELKQELEAKGYGFYGHSDTEALLTAYIHYGEKCLDKLSGIFAFAIYDEQNETLFFARDHIGVKPFFFSYINGKFIFASEIKAIFASGLIKPQIDRYSLAEIFLTGPGRTCGNGIFKAVSELKPGHCGVFSNTSLKIRQYWSLAASPHTDSEDETVKRTESLVTSAIKRQSVSDAPLCTLLSGGLDSSLITSVVSREIHKLHTFSVSYTDNDKYFKASYFQPNSDDEYIGIMSRFACTTHHAVTLRVPELADSLGAAASARDFPGMADVDSSLLLFCSEIKKHASVALSGECADELFGGYPWYHDPKIYEAHGFPWSRCTKDRAAMLKKGVLSGIDAEEYVMEKYLGTVKRTSCLDTDTPLQRRMREMFMLNFEWFMQTLAERTDRMSMANGLEVRVPLCDRSIAEYIYNVPWELKAMGGREKGLLRRAVGNLLPCSVTERKKSPYPKTHNPLYTQIVAGRLTDVLNNASSPLLEIVDKDHIKELITNAEVFSQPMYGQLMTRPQVMAYLLQINYWLKAYNIDIV